MCQKCIISTTVWLNKGYYGRIYNKVKCWWQEVAVFSKFHPMAPVMVSKQITSSFSTTVVFSVSSEVLELPYCCSVIRLGHIINFLFSNNNANLGKQWTAQRWTGNGIIFIIIYIFPYQEDVLDVFRIIMVWE